MGLVLHVPLIENMHDTAFHAHLDWNNSETCNYISGGPFGKYYYTGGYTNYERYRSTFNTKDISVSFWMKPTYGGTTWGDIISFNTELDDLSTIAPFRFEYTGDGYAWFNNGFITGDGGFGGINRSDGFVPKNFYHVVLTASIRNKRICMKEYLNGNLIHTYEGQQQHAKTLHFIGPVTIGDRDVAVERRLSDVRIYNHILSKKEIYDLSKRLMCHYTLEQTNGGAHDSSGMGMHSKNSSIMRTTIDRKYAYFNGESSHVATPDFPSQFSSNFSYNIWAKKSDWGDFGDSRILSCTESGGYNIESLQASVTDRTLSESENTIVFALYDKSKNTYNNLYTEIPWSSLSSGWHMFSGVMTSNQFTAYIDGKVVGTKSLSNGIGYSYANSIVLGADAGSTEGSVAGNYFTGWLNDFRFYASALSDQDVIDLYRCGATVDSNYSADTYMINESADAPVVSDMHTIDAPNFVENVYLIADDGSKFLRIFMHDLTYFTDCFPSIEAARNYVGGNCFSRLQDLIGGTFKNSQGEYEFILRYNKNSYLQNRWKQKICPFDYTSSTSSSDIGYQTVGSLNMYSYWGNTDGSVLPQDGMGLGLCSTGICLLDCQPTHGYWHGGLGQTEPYQGGMPAPNGNVYKFVELFVRIDDTPFDAEASITNTRIYMNEFREV